MQRAKRLLVVVAVAGLATTAACTAQAKQPDPGAQAPAGPTASGQATSGQATPSGPMPGMSMPAPASQNPAARGVIGGNPITIQSFAFAPATLTVKAGTTVTWTNHDQESHTVTSRTGVFHSPTLGNGATFSYTFTKPGRYDYLCSIHPFMTATVVVTP